MCLENGQCKSGWCDIGSRETYSYLQPNPGVCAPEIKFSECKSGLFCDGGKCMEISSRKVGQSCNRGEQCKGHNLFTGKGTQCCGGKYENKVKGQELIIVKRLQRSSSCSTRNMSFTK